MGIDDAPVDQDPSFGALKTNHTGVLRGGIDPDAVGVNIVDVIRDGGIVDSLSGKLSPA